MTEFKSMNFVSLFTKLSSISIFVSAVTLLTSLLAAKIMPVDVFGIYSLYQGFFLLLQNFLPFGMSMAVVVFKHKIEADEYSALMRFSLFFVTPVFTLIALLFFCLGHFLFDKFNPLLDYLALLFFALIQSLIVISLSSLRASYLLGNLTKVMLLNVSIIFVSTVVYFHIGGEFYTFYFMLGLLSLIPLLYSIYCENKILASTFDLSSQEKKKYIKFGAPVAVHAVFSSYLVTGDRVILGTMSDANTLGSYAYASVASSFYLFVVNNYASSWGVHLSKFISTHSVQELKVYYKKNCYRPLLFLLLVPPFFLVFFLFGYFYDIENLKDFYAVSCVLTTAYAIYGMTKYYMGYLNCLDRTALVMRTTLASCLCLVISCPFLYDAFGLIGVASSVLLSFFLNLVANIIQSNKVVSAL